MNVNSGRGMMLINSCATGNIDMVKILIERGANIHVNDNLAIRRAIMNGHYEIVNILKTF